MTIAALERLEACHEALIDALDHHDADSVERRVAELRRAADDVRAVGSWRDQPEVRERASRISALAEAARIRVNFLTDRTAGRLETLAAVRGQVHSLAYHRSGRRGR